MELCYKQPAKEWEETLPIGNGSLGGMIWGTPDKEKIGLNQDTLWSGYQRDKNKASAKNCLDDVHSLIFQGKYAEGQTLLEENMLGEFTESYLPLGDLYVDFHHKKEVKEYFRTLRLDEAEAEITYKEGGNYYKRSYFSSFPSNAIFFQYTCSKKEMNLTFSFESQLKYERYRECDGELLIKGQCPEHVDPSYLEREEPVIWGSKGQRFQARLMVLETDGAVSGEEIRSASYVIGCFTAVENPDVKKEYKTLGFKGIRDKHQKDYKKLYQRVSLSLGEQPSLFTDERLGKLKLGEEDPGLFALYFQYGRYLLISSSRENSMPANLQGIWSWEFRAPWSSNFTTNINVQMNYWPAQSCGLSECLKPYTAFLERLKEAGKQTAEKHFGCRGFCVNHNTDFWLTTNPVGNPYGETKGVKGSGEYSFFPLAGAWMCQELWRAYEYSLDLEFLKQTAYPIMQAAVLFCLDWLIEYEGSYVVCPSASHENVFLYTDGKQQSASIAYASTIDMTIIRELFGDFLKMCEVLGIEDVLMKDIKEKQKHLYPYKIGKYGQLQEWCEDFEEKESGHRHISHLYGLFPSELFEGDKALTEGCRKSLERRLEHGGGHTGWSCGWITNVYTVLKDSDKAYEFLKTLLTRSTYPNLWDAHPPFQIDGNFAGCAAIANMLVQDRGGVVTLLPALPKEWKTGYVKGLRIKGRKAVDISWRDGVITSQNIYEI